MKRVMLIIGILFSVTIYSQTAPQGSKTLNVEEKYVGEYFINVTDRDLSDNVKKALNERVPKKLSKYGFNDITIKEIGMPEGLSGVKFQVNLIDNITGDYFKIRLNMSYNPEYIIKEMEGGYCNEIETDFDKFTNKVTFSTPFLNPIVFVRVKTDENVRTYMKIDVVGLTANVNEKGAILLFEDGTKINRPEANIDVEVNNNGDGFIYSAFLPLSNEEIEKLSLNKLTDIRLYIYDIEIKSGKKYQEYMKCIKEK